MNAKNKKILFFSLFGLDMALTVALFVISIVMLATMPEKPTIGNPTPEYMPGMIGYLQQNPNVFLGAVVVPLFVLLAVNMVCLFLYVRKVSAKKKVELTDLTEEEKEALRAELLNDLNKPTEEKVETAETTEATSEVKAEAPVEEKKEEVEESKEEK